MKIVLVSPYDYAHPGGVNHHLFSLGDNLIRMGHEVHYCLPCSRPKDYADVKNITFMGRPIPIHASGSIVRSPVSPRLFFSKRIYEMLEREKFDIVHLHEPLFPPLTTAFLRYSNSITIGTFHATRSRSWGYWFWKKLLNKWVPKLDGRIAVSVPARDFISHYFPGDYAIIPNGIDLERFTANTEPLAEFKDGKINILFVGRMEKRKGFGYLFDAYRILKRTHPNIRLIVVGPRSGARRKYDFLIKLHKIKDIVFAGFVPSSELPRYYYTADIFCAPATGRESFGIILLEAMAASIPIVASDIGGFASVISRDEDGLLVKPKDPTKIVEALELLIHDKPLRDKLSANGKLKAQSFSWELVARQVMEYYEKITRESSRKFKN